MPSTNICAAPMTTLTSIVDVQPATAVPDSQPTAMYTISSSETPVSASPMWLAQRKGAVEKPVTASKARRTILPSG